MTMLFYLAAMVAIVATIMVISRSNAVHALLYLIVSLLAVSVLFFLLGAPFAAALEVIIYAGAIMVLFVFVMMLLTIGKDDEQRERNWLNFKMWIGPSLLILILLGDLMYVMLMGENRQPHHLKVVTPKQVSVKLFHPYLIGVELASFLLLPGLVGAYHLGRPGRKGESS